MKVLNRLNIITAKMKLFKVTEDIPDENTWDNDNTWYGFEHNIRLTKSANFKWYENCYADTKYGLTNKMLSILDKKFVQTFKPIIYTKGNDYYKIIDYTLAPKPEFAPGFPNFKVAFCSGGSRDTYWENSFMVIQPQHLEQIEEIL